MNTVVVTSKPEHISALRSTWRKTKQHYWAQVRRFLYSFGAILGAQIVGNIAADKPALPHFTTWHELQLYLVPLLFVAWKQVRPEMGAKDADAAPGVTIVPDEVSTDPAPVEDPQVVDDSEVVSSSDVPIDPDYVIDDASGEAVGND